MGTRKLSGKCDEMLAGNLLMDWLGLHGLLGSLANFSLSLLYATFEVKTYLVKGFLYMSGYVLQVYRYESIIAAFRAGGQSVDVEVTASDYFKWTKYNGILAALIAVCSCSIHSLLSHVIQDMHSENHNYQTCFRRA